MADISTLSDADLLQMLNAPATSSAAPGADGRMPVDIQVRLPNAPTPEAAAPSNISDLSDADLLAQLRQPEQPSIAADVAKSFGSGLLTGAPLAASGAGGLIAGLASGIAGLPGVSSTIENATRAARRAIGVPEEGFAVPGLGGSAVPPAVAQAAGPRFGEYAPQTTAGQYARTLGEFTPAAIAGPGGFLRRLGTQAVIPAIASETAGQLTQGTSYEPYARAVGGLAGGLLGGVPSAGEGLTRQEVKANATKLYNHPALQGAEASPQSMQNLAAVLDQHLTANNFSPLKATDAFGAIDQLRGLGGKGNEAATISNIRGVSQTLKRTAREVDRNGAPTADAVAAQRVQGGIRAYLDTLTQADLLKGNASEIGPILKAANQDWASQQAAFELPQTIKNVQRYAKKYELETPQDIAEAVARKGSALTPEERAQLAAHVRGGLFTRAVRLGAEADPLKSPFWAAAHLVGHALSGGLTTPLSVVGGIAGRIAGAETVAQKEALRRMILSRSNLAQTQPNLARVTPLAARVATGGLRGGTIPAAIAVGPANQALGPSPSSGRRSLQPPQGAWPP
jgi:hypothetical protein